MKSKARKRLKCALFGVAIITLLLNMVLGIKPSWSEAFYGDSVYPIVRSFLDALVFPIPGLFLVIFGLFIFLCWNSYLLFKSDRAPWKKIKLFVSRLALLFSVLIIWFYWFWGFNYTRADIVDRMNYQEVQPDSTWLFNEIEIVIADLNQLRQLPELSFLGDLTTEEILYKEIKVEQLNTDLESVLPQFKYDQKVKAALNFIQPDGFLLHWSTAGIYWPFTGESNVDRGVHYLKKSVTVAHELAHAHGLTSEGDCNFVAYVACIQSEEKLHQYSAQLSYIGYLLRDALKILGRKGLDRFYNQMSAEVKNDRKAIYDHHEQYTDYFPVLRDKIYDSYLKSQGVKGGITSYNYFVKLKYNWDRMNSNSTE